MHDAGVLALLDSSEIADFQKAIQLAPTSVRGLLKPKQLSPELEVLQQKLIQRLGEEKGKETCENINNKIYIGFYNEQGELQWLPR